MAESCMAVPVGALRERELGRARYGHLSTVAYDNRLESLRILYKHPIPNVTTPISCMDIDRVANSYLLCGGISGKIYLSNLNISDVYGPIAKEKFTLPDSLRHKYFVTSCQWYHDIRLFLSVSTGGDLTAWDLNSLEDLETYQICDSGKWRPQLHWNEVEKNNPLIAITDGTNHVRLYDLRVADCARQVRSKDSSIARAVRWLPSAHHVLFCGNNDGVLKVWDIRSARDALLTKTIRRDDCIRAMRFTSDGLFVVMVLYTGVVLLYDAVTLKRLGTFEFQDRRKWSEKMSNALDQFDIADEGSHIRVADLTRNSDPRIDATLTGHFSRVNACVYRPKYQQLYTAGADRNLLCWAPESERNRFHMEAETAVKKATMDDWSDDD
ncbi:unnamed protein product [Nippostrongylus brasiliensis]|uniref:WD_REPEATS_REGION domain-containing protein n=1 Tax=Nippostrongylus brasiliensis TaxID=27835 RepID=A0A0N4YR96_NIPBR|nr:unnamed protein product [Nippostrongylus brasiliensis]